MWIKLLVIYLVLTLIYTLIIGGYFALMNIISAKSLSRVDAAKMLINTYISNVFRPQDMFNYIRQNISNML